jgi:hypothetical protein
LVARAAISAATAAGSRNYVIATPTTASAAAKVDILQAADALDTVAVTEAALVIATTAAEAFAKAGQLKQSWQCQIKQLPQQQ